MSYPMLDIANEGGAKVPHLSEGSSLFLQDLQFLTDPTHENDWKQQFSTIWFEEWINKKKKSNLWALIYFNKVVVKATG